MAANLFTTRNLAIPKKGTLKSNLGTAWGVKDVNKKNVSVGDAQAPALGRNDS